LVFYPLEKNIFAAVRACSWGNRKAERVFGGDFAGAKNASRVAFLGFSCFLGVVGDKKILLKDVFCIFFHFFNGKSAFSNNFYKKGVDNFAQTCYNDYVSNKM